MDKFVNNCSEAKRIDRASHEEQLRAVQHLHERSSVRVPVCADDGDWAVHLAHFSRGARTVHVCGHVERRLYCVVSIDSVWDNVAVAEAQTPSRAHFHRAEERVRWFALRGCLLLDRRYRSSLRIPRSDGDVPERVHDHEVVPLFDLRFKRRRFQLFVLLRDVPSKVRRLGRENGGTD